MWFHFAKQQGSRNTQLTTTQKPLNTRSASRTQENAAPVCARCVLPYSIPFMFAMLHAFILMVAVAERPSRFNYGMMTSNHLELELNVTKDPDPAVSQCESRKNPDECEHVSIHPGWRCEWNASKQPSCVSRCSSKTQEQCKDFPQCEWEILSETCNERKDCRLSVAAWYSLNLPGRDWSRSYQAHKELPLCLRSLGFEAFWGGYGVDPFIVNTKESCKPHTALKANPLDCIPPRPHKAFVVTLEVVEEELWESHSPNILKCQLYKVPSEKSFAEHCLDSNNPHPQGGDTPESGETKTKFVGAGTTNWNPILFVRFEDSVRLPAWEGTP